MTVLPGVAFLAARTPRSQAYAQALARRGLAPARTLVFGPERPGLPGQSDRHSTHPPEVAGIVMPDYSIALIDTCRASGWHHDELTTGDVNQGEVAAWLADEPTALVIYSGFGGQIVRRALLDLGPPFLHAHGGWLPDHRGSTTIYYSLLERGDCGVSVFVLAPSIDTGPIVARRRYPAPPAGTDIDYAYDTAIRADLLADVLESFAGDGRLSEPVEQVPEDGCTYYVVHPVLKHLAMLSLEATEVRSR